MKKLILGLALLSTQIFGADLTLTISGLSSNTGDIFVAIWDSANGFPKDHETALDRIIVPATQTKIKIENLKSGKYAIAVFHDKNSDGVMNTNAIGIPKEGFGFSNNRRLLFGPPSFNKASFSIKNENLEKTIQIKHF